MNAQAEAQGRPETVALRAPKWNALKHGLRSDTTILPGDDEAAFEHMRRGLFEEYRPVTQDQAECVQTMAEMRWRVYRYRRLQVRFDGHLQDLLFGAAEALPGHLCERETHRAQHQADDCTRQELRMERAIYRARAQLLLLQKLRRQERRAQALEPEPICWGVESPVQEVATPRQEPIGADSAPPRRVGSRSALALATPASASSDGECGENIERTAGALVMAADPALDALPRKARRALKRRMAKQQRKREQAARRQIGTSQNRASGAAA